MRVTLRLTLFVLAAAAALTGARSPAPPDGTKMAGSLDELARESLAKIDDELQVAGLKQRHHPRSAGYPPYLREE